MKNRLMAKAVAEVLELESVGELCFALTTLRTETRGQLNKFADIIIIIMLTLYTYALLTHANVV